MKAKKGIQRIVAWMLAVALAFTAAAQGSAISGVYAAESKKEKVQAQSTLKAGEEDRKTEEKQAAKDTPIAENQEKNQEPETKESKEADIYEVTVTAPKGPFFQGEAVGGFAAVVLKNGEQVKDPQITWKCSAGSQIKDGSLTVGEGIKGGSTVTVTAVYVYGNGQSVQGQADVTVSERETVTVTGRVADCFNQAGIPGAEIIFRQSVNPLNQSITGSTDGSGKYSAVLYKGIAYQAQCRKAGYTGKDQVFQGVQGTLDFSLTTNLAIAITGAAGMSIGDIIQLSCTLPDAWRGEQVSWSSSNEGIASVGTDGSVEGTAAGPVGITASCHGVSYTHNMMVTKIPDANTQISIQIKRGGTEIGEGMPLYTGDVIQAGTDITAMNNKGTAMPVTAGSVTYQLQKKKGAEYKDVGSAAEKQVGEVYDGILGLEREGIYRLICTFRGDKWAAAVVRSREFSVLPRQGQSISFDPEQSTELVYGGQNGTERKSFTFIAKVYGRDMDFTFIPHSKSPKVEGLEISNITVGSLDENGFCVVKGEAAFLLNNVTELRETILLQVSCRHTAGERIYEDAVGEIAFTVKPKTISVSSIAFSEDRVYDGTRDAVVNEIVLDGVESRDSAVSAVKTGLVFEGSQAGEHTLNVTAEDGGCPISLTGNGAEKYILRQDNIPEFQGKIGKRTISVSAGTIELSKKYYTDNPREKAILEAGLKAQIYGNLVPGEENGIYEVLRKYHPEFRIDAVKESGLGEYAIYAYNPQPEAGSDRVMENYRFDLQSESGPDGTTRGTVIGILKIISEMPNPEEYEFIGDAVKKTDGGTVFIRANSGITEVIQAVNEDGAEKYNGVEYVTENPDNKKQYFDLANNVQGPAKGGVIGFRLIKQTDGVTTAYSDIGEIPFQVDADVEVGMTIQANAPRQSSFDQILETLTFGIFGNRENASASVRYRDTQSGLKEQYYKVIAYSDQLPAEKQEWEAFLEDPAFWSDAVSVSGSSVDIGFEDGQQIVLAKAVDQVGNERYVTSGGIVIDSERPEILEASIVGRTKDNVYRNAVEISVKAKDFKESGSYSGIADITYEAKLNGTATYSEETSIYHREAPAPASAEKLREEAQKEILPDRNIVIPIDTEKLSKKAEEKNEIEVQITAVDFAGNVSERKSIRLDLDIAAPEVAVSFDGTASNDNYFNKDRTVTVSVTDAYFDPSCVFYTGVESAEASSWRNMGNEKHQIKYTYRLDGIHAFDVRVQDKAGNISAMSDQVNSNYRKFVLDKTAPKITSIQYYMYVEGNRKEITPGRAQRERFYGNGKIYALISVEEHNFTEKEVAKGKVGGLELNIGAGQTGEGYQKPANQFTHAEGDIHILRMDYRSDANYTFSMKYTDLANNSLNIPYQTDYFTVDTAKPQGSIRISRFENVWKAFVKMITFGLFSNKNETVTIYDTSDLTSGVATVQYYKCRTPMTTGELNKVSWKKGSSVKITPNTQCVVYGKVTDRSGNYDYISTDGFVLDDQIDKPQISIIAPEPLNHIYRSDVNVKLQAEEPDPTGKGDYAGLKSVYYEVRSNGKKTQSGNLKVKPGAVRQKSVREVITVSAVKNYSNKVQVYVKAVDNAENTSEKTMDLKIDNKAPIVRFSFSNGDAQGGKYYKNDKALIITVDERNFDKSFTPRITSSSGGGYSFSGWSSNGETHTGTVTFSGDSDFQAAFDCSDLAGNKSNTENLNEFTVDKTQPEIRVSYDNENAFDEHYYNAGRTATITVTEHNFAAADVKTEVTAVNGEADVSAPSVGGWSSQGDTHTASVSFNSDADYALEISYTDLAGNAAEETARDAFTVDLTKPEITISGVADKSANKGTVAPVVKVSDTNFTEDGVTLSLTAASGGKLDIDSMMSKTKEENGQVVSFRNFGPDMDDIYTLTAKAADRAGNEFSKSIRFSVNRDGSTYIFEDETKKLIEKGYTKTPQNLVIQEINVDTLDFIELTYSKDGNVIPLTRDEDYAVEEEGDEGEWKKYTYTIFASCFNDEGEYSVNIYSEDRAENASNNRVKEKSIEFIVDQTAPSLAVSNLEQRGHYKEDTHEFTLSVKDNTTLSKVELYLDDELVHTYQGEELAQEDGILRLKIDSENEYQTVKMIAYDAAGNATEPARFEVLVTTNAWIQFYMNRPLFFGALFILMGGAAVIILFLRRKKS